MEAHEHGRARLPRRLIVAVDADAMSDNAIDTGLELARHFDARVEFVHAFWSSALGTDYVEDPRNVARGVDLASAVEQFIHAHLRDVLASSKSALRAEDVLRVTPGLPARVLIDRAQETNADLLVLGALRKRTVLDFGSTARSILAKAPCPVLVQPGPRAAIRRILVPVDMSAESRLALATACAWAKALGARVHALHCFDSSVTQAGATWAGIAVAGAIDELAKASRREFDSEMEAFDWGGVEHEATFVEGLPSERILTQAKAADMIAMGTHGRTGFASALLGSVAYSVLKHSTKPVLVVRDPRRVFQS
ncbi:MAG: universal stress protein [Planctomycetota bacterium]|nr:universal stress protein [Planctomycetota bacterium]